MRSAGELVITTGTVLGVVGGAVVGVASPASAATLTVTNTNDSGTGSLRQALLDAVDGDVITFSLPAGAIITLSSGDLDVDDTVTIQGPGANALTIDAAGGSRVFYLYPDAPGTTTISGLTITGGDAGSESDGGGIYAISTDLVLDRVRLIDNEAGEDGGGVALRGGSLAMTGALVSNNDAGGDGGGLDADDRFGDVPQDLTSVSVVGSTISGNTAATGVGGGAVIGNASGLVSITGSTVTGNTTESIGDAFLSGAGGGVVLRSLPNAHILDSSIADNIASGPGGGLVMLDPSGGPVRIGNVTVDRSTVSGNSAVGDGGGILLNRGKYFELINSTVSGNSATGNGGGVQVDASFGGKYGFAPGGVDLLHSTIVGNSAFFGGGINRQGQPSIQSEVPGEGYSSLVAADHTIVANNTTSEGGPDVGGGVEFRWSLVEDTSGGLVINEGAPGENIFGFDPALGPLADNGGPTLTHLPLAGSLVIDDGNPAFGGDPATDQRGLPRVFGAAIDIGSVEVGPTSAVTAGVSVAATTATSVEGGAPGVFTFTRSGPTTESLTIAYILGGTASGDDFQPMGIVTFPAGQASVTKQVVAIPDGVDEPDETVVVTLQPGTGYTIISPNSAIVTIVDELAADPPPCANAPEDQFTDVPPSNVHHDAIDCLKFMGVTIGGPEGLPADQYGPELDVTRGQMATFLARLIQEAGVIMPAGAPDAFDDDDGTTHEANINLLAAAGIIEGFEDGTYREGASVRRDQMASFLLRTHDFISDQTLSAGDNAFTDDEPGNVHEAAINALEEAGVIEGTATPGIYNPSGSVRRDQMASFLMRLANLLATEGNFPV